MLVLSGEPRFPVDGGPGFPAILTDCDRCGGGGCGGIVFEFERDCVPRGGAEAAGRDATGATGGGFGAAIKGGGSLDAAGSWAFVPAPHPPNTQARRRDRFHGCGGRFRSNFISPAPRRLFRHPSCESSQIPRRLRGDGIDTELLM